MRQLIAAAALALAMPSGAFVTTIHAIAAIVVDGPRGTADGRDVLANAFGPTDGKFFELGYDAVVDFCFDQAFAGPSGSVVEITNGNRDNWLEAVIVQVGMTVGSVFTLGETASPSPLLNTGPGIFTFLGGPFNTVRLIDVTKSLPPGRANAGPTGGFDVDSISVTAAPLPAAGLLMLGGLALLGVAGRRRAA